MSTVPTTTEFKEYVGLSSIAIGTGAGGTIPMLARVTLVNWHGQPLYDTYVKPTGPVTSYRETATGLDSTYFTDDVAVPFQEAQLMIAGWIGGKVVVGHQIWKDLQVLGIKHPVQDTRDVALFLPFRSILGRPNEVIGLPTLMWRFKERKIQESFVDPLENARAALELFGSWCRDWEGSIIVGNPPCALPPAAVSQYYT